MELGVGWDGGLGGLGKDVGIDEKIHLAHGRAEVYCRWVARVRFSGKDGPLGNGHIQH